MMERKQDCAIELFENGFNCAQSVLGVFCEDYGLSKEQALKITCGFGGGCRSGEICGAASAGVMVVGLKYGHYLGEDLASKSTCYAKTIEFLQAFKEKNNAVVCRELLGCDTSVPEGFKQAQEQNLFKTVCTPLIVSTIDLLESLGY